MKNNKLQWWLSLFGGIAVGIIGFFVTLALANFILRSTRVSSAEKIDPNLVFDNEVIIDNGSYKVTVLGMNVIDENDYLYHLDLNVENNTDTAYRFMPGLVKVNGYNIDASMSDEIGPHESKDISLVITTRLKEFGIDKISDIEIEFFIENEGKYIYDGNYLVKSNYYGTFDQAEEFAKKNTVEVYNNGKFRLSVINDYVKEMNTYPLILENLTDYTMTFPSINVEINGVIINTSVFLSPMPGHSKAIDKFDLYLNDIEKQKVGKKVKNFNALFTVALKEENLSIVEEFETGKIQLK